MPSIQYQKAESPEAFQVAAALFQRYADSLGIDLKYQSFEQELKEIAKQYGASRGGLILASMDGKVIACVGVRQFEGRRCELKRMYVLPERQGNGIGRELPAGRGEVIGISWFKRLGEPASGSDFPSGPELVADIGSVRPGDVRSLPHEIQLRIM